MSRRFEEVDSLRGIAALTVVINHQELHFILSGNGIGSSSDYLRDPLVHFKPSSLLGERGNMPRLAVAMDIVSLASHALRCKISLICRPWLGVNRTHECQS